MPANSGLDDLILVIFGNPTAATVATPSGWTSIGTQVNSTFERLTVFAKRSDGTEHGTNVDFVTSGSVSTAYAVIFEIRGWSGDITAAGIAITAGAIGTSTNPDPDSLTPSWGALDTLWIATCNTDAATLPSTPANYTFGSGGGSPGELTAYRFLNAATENPGVFTDATSSHWVALTIAVKPGNFPLPIGYGSPNDVRFRRWPQPYGD